MLWRRMDHMCAPQPQQIVVRDASEFAADKL
jgi:hypothetical protein